MKEGIFVDCRKLQKKVRKVYGNDVCVREEDGNVVLSGTLKSWDAIVGACTMCVDKKRRYHVINDLQLLGVTPPKMKVPEIQDQALDGRKPDVLIIGGGISGASIARELMKWKLDVLLVDKEADVAMHASGRNDGEVHPGIDLGKGTLKQKYVIKGNRMYGRICRELDVPFRRCGQYVGMMHWSEFLPAALYVWQRKHICGVSDARLMPAKVLRRREPHLNKDIKFAVYNSSAGTVCPYGLTIAYAENAAANGAEIALNTAVLSMETEGVRIKSVLTNRGRIYPKLVINAAGVFAEDVAKMAGDRFYSIHPRRGTNAILDKKAGYMMKGIASWKTLKKSAGHTKGGGIVHTAHDNLLVGPDAIETYEKENFATESASIENNFNKQRKAVGELSERDIITYFTGVRAPTFEEDFVIEPGRRCHNLIHCAGIQSPGLTTAPAVAKDVAYMAAMMVSKYRPVRRNEAYNPYRKGVPRLKEMRLKERNALIKKRPDYGVMICRCEEVSKGEIIDALMSPLPVYTVDGIKKRVRPGMGRCQGGFCMPLVAGIISEVTGQPLEKVKKSGGDSYLLFGKTKAGDSNARK